MGSLNKVMLIGNLGKDPEVRAIPSGAKVANFSIATTESYTDKNGQKVDKTEWHNIVLWRGLAEVAEKYLHKGGQVYIEGRLQTRSWEDANQQKRYTTEIIGDSMVLLGRPGGAGAGQGGESFRSNDNTSSNGGGNNGGNGGGYSRGGKSDSYAPSSVPPMAEDDLPF